MDVTRPEVDIGGFDLILEAKGHVRHVQLKSRWTGGNARSVKINSRLREHLDPCVVWVFWDVDPATCRVSAKYRYSASASWPQAQPGETSFVLKWANFMPGYLDIAGLDSLLF